MQKMTSPTTAKINVQKFWDQNPCGGDWVSFEKKITWAFNVEPYMEVEADSMEKYLSGISLINKTHDDFVDISARRLIEQKRNK